jgi:hypothetical protein
MDDGGDVRAREAPDVDDAFAEVRVATRLDGRRERSGDVTRDHSASYRVG